MPKVLKAGDIVRVGRDGDSHGVRFGALMRIDEVFPYDNDAAVVPLSASADPIRTHEGWANGRQYVDLTRLKYAKQANRFDHRRGQDHA